MKMSVPFDKLDDSETTEEVMMGHVLSTGRACLVAFTTFVLSGCVSAVHMVEVAPGCPLVPETIHKRIGIDAKLGASTFGKIATGDASLLITPDIVSAVSQAVSDSQVAEGYICAAGKRGELKTPEQFEHARHTVQFYSTKPTPEQAIKFRKEFPFPKGPNTSEILSHAADQLASKKLQDRLEGIRVLHKLGSTSHEHVSIVVEILSRFVRQRTSSQDSIQGGHILPDAQAAMSALTSKELGTASPQDPFSHPLNLNGTYLPGIDLENGNLAGALLSDAHWEKSMLRGANLRKSSLEYMHLQDADLSYADLQEASLLGANLDLVDLRGSKLQRANLQGAQLKGSNLEGADLSDANLKDSRVDGARWRGAIICRTKGINQTAMGSMLETKSC